MKLFNVIIFLLIKISIANAQEEENALRYILIKDNTSLFVNNEKRNRYTIEFQSDTLVDIGQNSYFYNDREIEINSVKFNNGKITNVMGSPESEISAMKWHQRVEKKFQEKKFKAKVKVKEELYYNTNHKPFLIWYYEPNKIKSSAKLLEVEYGKSQTSELEEESYEDDSTLAKSDEISHHLFLEFVVHGNTCVYISTYLLENDDLAKEIANLKKIANSLVVFGGDIDLDILNLRSKNNGKFIYQDSLENISLEIPGNINVLKNPFNRKDALILSFPEKNNIVNTASIIWIEKAKAGNFEQFINKGQKVKRKLSNLKELPKEGNLARYSIINKGSFYTKQDIYIEGEKNYYYINFTATLNTYDFNIGRFQELLSKLKLK
ncbi:MAG: hypothetical protein KA313_02760 [Pseudarcicella sp.]|nr:hypothetical protein [Pseudarcicella sp.]MBP6409998.1 hypothetical protein [Pseudarcicella sp.]